MTQENKVRLDKWVSEWYGWLGNEISKNIAKGIMNDYSEDLLHHMIIDTYKLSDDKITQMLDDDKLRWWILRGASLQLRSSTSPFYLLHRREKMNSREPGLPGSDSNIFEIGSYELDIEIGDLWDCFIKAQEQLHWYHREIFKKKFHENLTIQEIYQFYNISKTHLIKDLNKAINEIRGACSHIE